VRVWGSGGGCGCVLVVYLASEDKSSCIQISKHKNFHMYVCLRVLNLTPTSMHTRIGTHTGQLRTQLKQLQELLDAIFHTYPISHQQHLQTITPPISHQQHLQTLTHALMYTNTHAHTCTHVHAHNTHTHTHRPAPHPAQTAAEAARSHVSPGYTRV